MFQSSIFMVASNRKFDLVGTLRDTNTNVRNFLKQSGKTEIVKQN